MSLEPGRLCKVSWRARKTLDQLHLKTRSRQRFSGIVRRMSSQFTVASKLAETDLQKSKRLGRYCERAAVYGKLLKLRDTDGYQKRFR